MGIKNHWPIPAAQWIWLDGKGEWINCYAEFRGECRVGAAECVKAYVAADSDYELFVNGERVGFNQFPSQPEQRFYNVHDISGAVKRGRNCIAVRGYYRGETFFTYAKGRPGVLVGVMADDKVVGMSDGTWRGRLSRSYRSGDMAKTTSQLGYTVEYRSEGEDGWQGLKYDDSEWREAVSLGEAEGGFCEELLERPIAGLQLDAVRVARLAAQGYLIRGEEKETPALTMMSDMLRPAELVDYPQVSENSGKFGFIDLPRDDGKAITIEPIKGRGAYLVFDLGCEEAGYLDIEIDAGAETVLDIAHGEHLDDLRVRAAIGGRNFADRYYARQGRQRWFQSFRRLGCRYLQVHIAELKAPLKIYHVSLRGAHYPFDREGWFACDDSMLNYLWGLSTRTLDLCAHEHYEDCPWREQSLYGCDGRLQALYGFYAYGETAFPAASWQVLGKGMREDGLLEITGPTKSALTIPGFSLHWITALGELYQFSGDIKLVREQMRAARQVLDQIMERWDGKGAVANSTEGGHWHFYEWTEGMAGSCSDACAGKDSKASYDAMFNFLLIEALGIFAELCKAVGEDSRVYRQMRGALMNACHKLFWNDERGLYVSQVIKNKHNGHYSQLVQATALTVGMVPRGLVRKLAEKLREGAGMIEAELPSKYFLYRALLEQSRGAISWVLNDMRACFGRMIQAGATSLWEHADGADAFGRAGSLCHAWSSVFNYVAGAYVLGIQPTKPGFEEFTFAPCPGDLARGEGEVLTPRGAIRVSWQDMGKELRAKVSHPKGLVMKVKKPLGKTLRLD